MEKRHAFVLSLLITLFLGVNFYFISGNKTNSVEKVTVARVIDGDTLKLEDGRLIRFLNINAPEKNQPESVLSNEYVKGLDNKTIDIEITGIDKYKRSLARVYYNGNYINFELVRRGFSTKFLVNDKELEKFADAEKFAVENSLGMWNRSTYYGCFSIDINKYEETVIIVSKCGDIDMKGWKMRDESRKFYLLSLLLKGRITIHSDKGVDNSTDIFMNLGNVWNDDRDSLYLLDEKGGIAGYEVYGY